MNVHSNTVKANNGVRFEQHHLQFVSQEDTKAKYRVFESGDRFLIGRRLHGSITFDIVDDCRTEKFAHARCKALNEGVVK